MLLFLERVHKASHVGFHIGTIEFQHLYFGIAKVNHLSLNFKCIWYHSVSSKILYEFIAVEFPIIFVFVHIATQRKNTLATLQ